MKVGRGKEKGKGGRGEVGKGRAARGVQQVGDGVVVSFWHLIIAILYTGC